MGKHHSDIMKYFATPNANCPKSNDTLNKNSLKEQRLIQALSLIICKYYTFIAFILMLLPAHVKEKK